MPYREIAGPDYTLAFLSIAGRVSAACAYLNCGDSKKAESEIRKAMKVVRAVEANYVEIEGIPITEALLERLSDLTKGVEIDLEKPLNPEDE